MKKLLIITLITFVSTVCVALNSYSEQKPQYGGHLRIIVGGQNTPKTIGYFPKQQFADAVPAPMWSERLLDLKTTGDFAPSVAKGYDVSPDLKTITIPLRDDVKFQDGTPCNAEAVVWSLQKAKDAGKLAGGKRIEKIEVADNYTVKVTLNASNNQIIYDLARVFLYSPTAYEKNGEEWAINNSVSTAAFQVSEFKRDIVLKMKKFDGYWRPGKPYLDSAELITVKEPATAAAMMRAKQADIWMGSTAQEAADLKAMGLSVVECPTIYYTVYCDSTNPNSPFANKKVREAIEYAIDRKAMAEAIGFGFQLPVYQPTHKGTAGYNPDYPVRAYNPEKAKQLLAEAGFAKGIKTKMIAQAGGGYNDAALVVQSFLAEIGINVEIDLCDVGRFWGSVMGGWEGLLMGPYAVNPEFCVAWLHHFGPEPIMKFASMAKSEKYLDLCEKLIVAPDKTAMRKLTMEMVTQAGLDCMFIPCTLSLGTSIHVPNFHTDYYTDLDWTYWSLWNDWLEKK
jgi:peptide/nickel transport system substrate-binding protein